MHVHYYLNVILITHTGKICNCDLKVDKVSGGRSRLKTTYVIMRFGEGILGTLLDLLSPSLAYYKVVIFFF